MTYIFVYNLINTKMELNVRHVTWHRRLMCCFVCGLMRLGITLGGGFSPGPSKILFNDSSLVAIISHRRQKSSSSMQASEYADITLMRLARGCVQLRWIITSLAWSHTCCRVNRIASSPSRLPGGFSDVTTNAEKIRSKIRSTDLLLSRLSNKVCCETRCDGLHFSHLLPFPYVPTSRL